MAIHYVPLSLIIVKRYIKSYMILIVSIRRHAGHFLELPGSGSEWGASFTYEIQDEAGSTDPARPAPPQATATATDAPPGGRVTPAPTKAKPAAAKATAPAAEGAAAEKPKKGLPGFTAVFAIAGILAIAYLVMRRRE